MVKSDSDATDPCDALSIGSAAFRRDPYPTYERLRASCPVAHTDDFLADDGGLTVLTRYDDVRMAGVDWKTYTSEVVGVSSFPMGLQRDYQLLPIEVDPPVHSRYRSLIAPPFRAEHIEALRPRLLQLIEGLIDEILERGESDLVADLVVPLSTGALGAFMQLPREDQPRWAAWGYRLFNAEAEPEDARAATREMEAYMDGVIDAHEADGSSEFFRLLIESEVDGQRLTRSEIRRLGMMIIATAGHETSASAMSMALYYLAGNRRALSALREDPELMPTALEEMLRWTSPVQMFGRNTTRDVELHGTTIPKGAAVAVAYGSANFDPEMFPEPDEVRLDRTPNRHLTFGVGPHFCVGAPIARLEMELLLSVLAQRVERIDISDEDALVWNPRVDRRGLWKLPATLVPFE